MLLRSHSSYSRYSPINTILRSHQASSRPSHTSLRAVVRQLFLRDTSHGSTGGDEFSEAAVRTNKRPGTRKKKPRSCLDPTTREVGSSQYLQDLVERAGRPTLLPQTTTPIPALFPPPLIPPSQCVPLVVLFDPASRPESFNALALFFRTASGPGRGCFCSRASTD